MYTREKYEKDLQFIEKIEHLKSNRIEFIAYFFVLASCLAAHILYMILFAKAGVKNMVIFNIFSVSFYITSLFLIGKAKTSSMLHMQLWQR